MVNSSPLHTNNSSSADLGEVEQLKAQVTALEQLLEVYEKETVEKSNRLEQTLIELQHHTQRLTHAESVLATLRTMLNSMEDAVVVVNQQGEFLFLNPSAEHVLGIKPTTLSLQTWAKDWCIYLPDQESPYPLNSFPLMQTIQGGYPEATEIFVPTPQGTETYWFNVTAQPLCNQDGSPGSGGIAVFHNITELKQKELALRESESRSREQAEQLQQALHELQSIQTQLIQTEKMSSLGQLVAGIAHEINNPVNFIHGNLVHIQNYTQELLQFIHTVQQSYPNPVAAVQDKAEAIELDFLIEDLPNTITSMKVGAERIRQIVLSLRNFSRLDEAACKSVDLYEGIESTLLILRHRLEPKSDQPSIAVERSYCDLPPIECYPGPLNQVFMNILSNAIDALENSSSTFDDYGKITIRTSVIHRESGQIWVEIAIADNGSGIPASIQNRIFEPFFTTKPVGKGTGMGMSISYQIITEQHEGELLCHSTLGRGTEFIIRIPLQQRCLVGQTQ